MFKLVGKETFYVGSVDTKATINIDAVSGFAYEYTLEINGKSLKKYMENRSKVTSTWLLNLDGTDCRVVLGRYLHCLHLNCTKEWTWCSVRGLETELGFALGDENHWLHVVLCLSTEPVSELYGLWSLNLIAAHHLHTVSTCQASWLKYWPHIRLLSQFLIV